MRVFIGLRTILVFSLFLFLSGAKAHAGFFTFPGFGVQRITNMISGTYSNENGERQYRFYIPKNNVAARPLPLLVFLHGCGQNPEDFFTGTEIGPVADREQFYVLLPVQDRANNPLACWNWYLPDHQARDSGEPSIIVGMIDKLAREYKIDRTRIYLAGFSSGAAMASVVSGCYPDIFSAVAIGSGVSFGAATNLSQAFQAMNSGGVIDPNHSGEEAYRCSGLRGKMMPAIIFHGTRDSTVNPVNAQQVFDSFAQLNDFADDGRDNDSVNSSQALATAGQVPNGYSYKVDTVYKLTKPIVQKYMVQPMQHAWSGGSGFQYMDPSGPEASEIMWNFFKLHRK